MSYERSPRPDCSMTIGTRLLISPRVHTAACNDPPTHQSNLFATGVELCLGKATPKFSSDRGLEFRARVLLIRGPCCASDRERVGRGRRSKATRLQPMPYLILRFARGSGRR